MAETKVVQPACLEMPISVRDVTKVYHVYQRPADRLLELLFRRPRHRDFYALRNVSFDLDRAATVGIVGENGAGKSTLLKLMARTARPTSGSLAIEGKVAAILELGAGFQGEFSGLENVRLNAAILGLSEREFEDRLPEIIAFSELGDAIGQPVKTYSSGMVMRLAFSIATNVNADILIIDEALSVGDGYFQKKCINRITDFCASGKTLLFCSHAMYYVTMLCQQAMWLDKGEIRAFGPTVDVVNRYENYLIEKGKKLDAGRPPASPMTAPGTAATPSQDAPGRRLARITGVRLSGDEGGERNQFASGENVHVSVDFASEDPTLSFHLGVGVNRADEVEVFAMSTGKDSLEPLTGRQAYRVRLTIRDLPLVKGEFTLYIFILDEQALHIYDRQILPKAFTVVSSNYEFGLIRVVHEWSF